MNNKKKLSLLLILAVFASLVIPQGVLARPQSALTRPQSVPADLGVAAGQIIFKTAGDRLEELNILNRYQLKMIRRNDRLGYVLAAAPVGTDVRRLASRMSGDRAVRYAQPNFAYRLFGMPDDPYFSRQWALKSINAESGWALADDSSNITIAILDSGVDINHPDLKGRLVPGVNTVNPLKSARDDEGHGTHVAGIAAAVTGNGLGVAGISRAKIMPVKVFDGWNGTDMSISDGIIWAVDHGADVINMSFGSFYQSEVLNEAIEYAYEHGVVMVAAAGNWASQDISYPAAVSKVISVSAINKRDELASFSSFGPEIDVCAPGEGIYSTIWDPYKGSTYSEMSGTSMASPMVAGLAALILAKYPGISNDEVRQIIEVSAVDLGDPGWDPKYGHGRIDIFNALNLEPEKIDDSNSTPEEAVDIQTGQVVKGKIDFGSDEDWYQIQVPDRSGLELEVLPAGQVSPAVEIYNAFGELMASFNTPSTEEVPADPWSPNYGQVRNPLKISEAVHGLVTDLTEGKYLMKVFGNHFRWSEEEYTLTARILTPSELQQDANEPNDSNDQATVMQVGETVQGTILNAGDEDWFKVDLPGPAYRLKLEGPKQLDLALEVESQSNFTEPKTDEAWNAYYDSWYYEEINRAGLGQDEEGILVLPEKGGTTYYIRVTDVGGASANAVYRLTVSEYVFAADAFEPNDTRQDAAPVSMGTTVTGGFHQADDKDWYWFETTGTGVVTIKLQEPHNAWCDLELFANQGEQAIAAGSNGYQSEQDLAGDLRTYYFKVSPGKYYLQVTNWTGTPSDEYAMNLQFNSFAFLDQEDNDTPSQAQEITVNTEVAGTLFPEGDVDYYFFDVDWPQPYLVFLTPPENVDTAALVLKEMDLSSDGKDGGQQGSPGDWGSGDDMSEPILEPVTEISGGVKGQPDTGVFTPSEPGRYYLEISALQGQSAAPYALSIQPFSAVPDPWEINDTQEEAQPIRSGVAVQPTFMGIEDPDWFKIYVPGSGLLTVNMMVPGDIDGVFEVFDSGGKLLGKVDDAMQGIEEGASFPAAGPGYLYIKAYDYLGNSSVLPYTLTARYQDTQPPVISSLKVSGRKVSFDISEDAKVFIKILNNRDQFVAMIIDGARLEKGGVTGTWNGIDAGGRKAFPGTYKLKIVAIDGSGNASPPVYGTIKN